MTAAFQRMEPAVALLDVLIAREVRLVLHMDGVDVVRGDRLVAVQAGVGRLLAESPKDRPR